MKKVSEKVIPQKVIKASKKTIEQRWCDICGDKMIANNWNKFTDCDICIRDICRKHTVRDNQDGGDHYETYCTICYALWYPALNKLSDKHYEEEEALRRKIKKESLRHEKTVEKE